MGSPMQTSQGPITSSPTIFLPGDHSSLPSPTAWPTRAWRKGFLDDAPPSPPDPTMPSRLDFGPQTSLASTFLSNPSPLSLLPSGSSAIPQLSPHLPCPLAITSCSSQTAALLGKGNYTWVSVGGRGNTRDTLTVRLTMRKKHVGPSSRPVPLMGQPLSGLPFGVFPPQPRETCSP